MTLTKQIKKIIEQYENLQHRLHYPAPAIKGLLNEIEKALDNQDKDVCPSCENTVPAELVSKCRKCGSVQCPKC